MVKLTLEGKNAKGENFKTSCLVPDAIEYSHNPSSVKGSIPLSSMVPAGIAKVCEKWKRYITDGINPEKQSDADIIKYVNAKAKAVCGTGPIRSARVGDPLAKAFRSLVEDHCKAVGIKIPKKLSGTVDTMSATIKALGVTDTVITNAKREAGKAVKAHAARVAALTA